MPKSDMADTLRIDSEQTNNIEFMKLNGVVDSHTYEEIEAYIEQLLSGGISRLVIDMQGVRYVSSAGIGVFIGALARARQSGGDLLLLNVTTTVREVLEVLGLLSMFFMAPTKAAAMAYFERAGIAKK